MLSPSTSGDIGPRELLHFRAISEEFGALNETTPTSLLEQTDRRQAGLMNETAVGWRGAQYTCVIWTVWKQYKHPEIQLFVVAVRQNMNVRIAYHWVKKRTRKRLRTSLSDFRGLNLKLLSRYIPSVTLFYQRESGNGGIVLHTSLISFHSECQTDTVCLSLCTV